jgi:hypothetical protein
MEIKFWVHTCSTTDFPLDGRGFSTEGRGPSTKVTVWKSKDAVLAFCERKFKDKQIVDHGNRIEIDYRNSNSPRVLAFTEVTVVA